MKTLEEEFQEELARFDSEFRELAEAAGYPFTEENMLHLMSVYFPILCDGIVKNGGPEQANARARIYKKYPPRSGSYLEACLGHAFMAYFIALEENSFSIFIAATKSLGMARALLNLPPLVFGEEARKKIISAMGRKGSDATHVETKALEKEVAGFWKANIDPALSNDEAATILRKQFPLAFRTLSKYVGRAKNAQKVNTV